MIAELTAWSGRCDAMLVGLEAEIKKVKAESERRAKQETRAERQVKAVTDDAEKGGSSTGQPLAPSRATRGLFNKREAREDSDDDEDVMDVDSGTTSRKKGGVKGFFKR